jgi:hypothetical protein
VSVIQHTFPKMTSAESSDGDIFITIALFCGVGLLVSLLLISEVAALPLWLTPDVMVWM